MKRKGFTLAEILITLGIVGVVAALTAPALVKNTAGAKVGPTLAKVVNTIEVANEQLMLDKNISDLAKVYGPDRATYFADLSKYIRKAGYNSTKRTTIYKYNTTHNPTTSDGSYTGEFLLPEGASIYPYLVYSNNSLPSEDDPCYNSIKGRYMDLFVDINGSSSGNNMLADDVFLFTLDRSGSMVPWGSQVFVNEFKQVDSDLYIWTNMCNANSVRDASYCAGSIFENNLKIIYQ